MQAHRPVGLELGNPLEWILSLPLPADHRLGSSVWQSAAVLVAPNRDPLEKYIPKYGTGYCTLEDGIDELEDGRAQAI